MSSTIANNDDLLIEILRHLPTKSLFNFKFVNKHWKSIISGPQFFRRRYPVSGLILHRNPSLAYALHDFVTLKTNPTSTPYLSLIPPNINSSGLKIWQSCNGLLLCSRYCPPYLFNEEYFLRNPTTIQFVTIRPPPDAAVSYDAAVGYGVKTLRIAPDNLAFRRGVFSNGSIHWINHHNDSLFLNVEEEQLRVMPMPQHPVEEDEGSASLSGISESPTSTCIWLSFMTPELQNLMYMRWKDYSGWFVKYRVDIDGIIAAFPIFCRLSIVTKFILIYNIFEVL